MIPDDIMRIAIGVWLGGLFMAGTYAFLSLVTFLLCKLVERYFDV